MPISGELIHTSGPDLRLAHCRYPHQPRVLDSEVLKGLGLELVDPGGCTDPSARIEQTVFVDTGSAPPPAPGGEPSAPTTAPAGGGQT